MLYLAVFSILSIRERRRFLDSAPGWPLILALVADVSIGTALTFAGLPTFPPLPWWQLLAIFGYAMTTCLVLNDQLKLFLLAMGKDTDRERD